MLKKLAKRELLKVGIVIIITIILTTGLISMFYLRQSLYTFTSEVDEVTVDKSAMTTKAQFFEYLGYDIFKTQKQKAESKQELTKDGTKSASSTSTITQASKDGVVYTGKTIEYVAHGGGTKKIPLVKFSKDMDKATRMALFKAMGESLNGTKYFQCTDGLPTGPRYGTDCSSLSQVICALIVEGEKIGDGTQRSCNSYSTLANYKNHKDVMTLCNPVEVPMSTFGNGPTALQADKLQCGDCLHWDGHVTVYLGNGKVINGSNTRLGVRLNDLSAYKGKGKCTRVIRLFGD